MQVDSEIFNGKRIAVISGDGIGIEVAAEAIKMLRVIVELFGRPIKLVEFD